MIAEAEGDVEGSGQRQGEQQQAPPAQQLIFEFGLVAPPEWLWILVVHGDILSGWRTLPRFAGAFAGKRCGRPTNALPRRNTPHTPWYRLIGFGRIGNHVGGKPSGNGKAAIVIGMARKDPPLSGVPIAIASTNAFIAAA